MVMQLQLIIHYFLLNIIALVLYLTYLFNLRIVFLCLKVSYHKNSLRMNVLNDHDIKRFRSKSVLVSLYG